MNTKILKSRFFYFGAVSQNAQGEVRRLSSRLYLRKAGKVLLRKGGHWGSREADVWGDAERLRR